MMNNSTVFASVGQEELTKQAEATEKTFQEYWSSTKAALLCEDNKKPTENFCYGVKPQENRLEVGFYFNQKYIISSLAKM